MVETIRIVSDKHPQGWVLINAEDFDPAKHFVWVDDLTSPVVPIPRKTRTPR